MGEIPTSFATERRLGTDLRCTLIDAAMTRLNSCRDFAQQMEIKTTRNFMFTSSLSSSGRCIGI
jgi:hypothetical protein